MRTLAAVSLFAACVLGATAAPAGQDAKQPEKKKTQPKKVDPKTFIPDAATLAKIKEKTEELRKAVAALKEKKIADDVLVEVEIYLKAAENIVRFEEWLHANSVKWTLQTLDEGLERAKLAEGGKSVWRDAPGKWVNRAYRSSIDNSIQPYAVLLPHDYGKDPKKKWRLDIVLHGRDGALTEAKFLATHGKTAKEAPKDLGYVQFEPYGRGNNAYRWAGETDVWEVVSDVMLWGGVYPQPPSPKQVTSLDRNRVVLRGFSMGGAGTWHIGLHHPSMFCVIGPGAGFTTTHGYVANLTKQLPDYQEKCLRIYDAIDYAENAFNVPVVAYSGEKDAQKRAADNIENALKRFKEPFRFTHLVAPGLEHQMPAEWQAKAEVEYRKYADKGREPNPDRIRFVTYTPKFMGCDWLTVDALETTYEKAVVDATRKGDEFVITASNVRRMRLTGHRPLAEGVDRARLSVTINGQAVETSPPATGAFAVTEVEKVDGKWHALKGNGPRERDWTKLEKRAGLQGPIDDAFTGPFQLVEPSQGAMFPANGAFAAARAHEFALLWDRYFRAAPPINSPEAVEQALAAGTPMAFVPRQFSHNLALFGDPQSNPLIAKVLPKLPIIWTEEKLVVNGVEYDPKTHVPVLIYPNPLRNNICYVVLNSGHTFKEADLKGTNALLFPRLGDWAVIKPTPTRDDPAAYEVVAAGLFDENWQCPKK